MMRVYEQIVEIPASAQHRNLLAHLEYHKKKLCADGHVVRFVVVGTSGGKYQCEVGILDGTYRGPNAGYTDIFAFTPRKVANRVQFNVVFLVPTGIGAEVGGHAGDAGPACRLLAQSCDRLITHPNTVNASDLNELPSNGLYVEGSVITRLMMGTAGLEPRQSNRVLVVMEAHSEPQVTDWAINAVNAARASCGFDCSEFVILSPSFQMEANFTEHGRAVGCVSRLDRLFRELDHRKGTYDAVALTSVIKFPLGPTLEYWTGTGGVNPWGGVEAMLTHSVSAMYNVPSAHSPELIQTDWLEQAAKELGDPKRALDGLGVVEPTMAAEVISMTFLHCILRGLHRSPGIIVDQEAMRHHSVITSTDIACLVQPDRCIGLPTLAALENGVPVIAVRDKTNVMQNDLSALPWGTGQLMFVNNYLEASGMLNALRAGVNPDTVRRPLRHATVSESLSDAASARVGISKTRKEDAISKVL